MRQPSKADPYSRDLLGQPIPPPAYFRNDGALRRIGYADRPGTGPKGQRCGTCIHAHLCVHLGAASHKCELMTAVWNYSTATDINIRAPACSHWQRKPFSPSRS